MPEHELVVIGGGAAGMVAAISAARAGKTVLICEKTPQLGKKLLATGDGRCNLLNDDLSEAHYNANARPLVQSVFDHFGKAQILDFFSGLGLQTYAKDGRVFPVTNQAASVLKVLQIELARLRVPVEFGFDCTAISASKAGITVTSKEGKPVNCRNVVVTGGGKTYPAFGSDGSIYGVATQLGHSIVVPVPSTVPLVSNDPLCHTLQGQRIPASARGVVGGVMGEATQGELLFTKYGLSGTCILDVSGPISIALNREQRKDVTVAIDLAPCLSETELKTELTRRKRLDWPDEDMMAGILPNKVSAALAGIFRQNDLDAAARSLKQRRFTVTGTRGWNEAEFTAGGVAVDEVKPTLESKRRRGVYFAGEVLDVNGRRGGYNLAWAWASGFIAGHCL